MMPGALAAAMVLMLNYAALVMLALAMNRHHQQVFEYKPGPYRVRALRGVAALLLGLSATLGATVWGFSVGVFGVWGGCLSMAACAVVFSLPYVPQLVVRTTLAAPLVLVLWFWLGRHAG